MSNKFINIRVNDDKGLQSYDDRIVEGVLNSLSSNVVLGFKKEDDIPSQKSIVECTVNLLYGLTMNLSLSTDYKSSTTKDQLDVEMVNLLRSTSQLLVHIVNSTSWRDGEFHSFDKLEIGCKLKYLQIFSRF